MKGRKTKQINKNKEIDIHTHWFVFFSFFKKLLFILRSFLLHFLLFLMLFSVVVSFVYIYLFHILIIMIIYSSCSSCISSLYTLFIRHVHLLHYYIHQALLIDSISLHFVYVKIEYDLIHFVIPISIS